MNDDFSEVINRFSDILKEKDIDLSNIAGEFSSPAHNNNQNETNDSSSSLLDENYNSNTNSTNSNNSSSDFSLDIETILKIKDIISKLNKNQNSPRNNLLHSLAPYLENEKREKLEQYIKIANLLSLLEDFDINISFLKNNKKGYDFILIITLFLLIF